MAAGAGKAAGAVPAPHLRERGPGRRRLPDVQRGLDLWKGAAGESRPGHRSVCARVRTRVCATGSFQNPQPFQPVGALSRPSGRACSLFTINQRSLRKRLGPAAPPLLPSGRTTARGLVPAQPRSSCPWTRPPPPPPTAPAPSGGGDQARSDEGRGEPAVMEKYLRVGGGTVAPESVIPPRSPETQPLPAVNDDFVG